MIKGTIKAASMILVSALITAGCSGNTATVPADTEELVPVTQSSGKESTTESRRNEVSESSVESTQDSTAQSENESTADVSESVTDRIETESSADASESSAQQSSGPAEEKKKENNGVRLKNYTGMKTADAKKEIEALGLECELKDGYSDSVEKGFVISQSPSGGALVKKSSTVVLYSSLGSEEQTKASEAEEPSVVQTVVDVTGVVLNRHEAELTVGESIDLDVYFEPYNATRTDYLWHWSSVELADMNGSGIVTAKAPGVVEVTAECYNGIKDTCIITITEKPQPAPQPQPQQSQQPAPEPEPEPEPEPAIVQYNTTYNSARVYQDIEALCKKYPELLSSSVIGSSEKGRNIVCMKMGKGSKKGLIVGGIHSREHITISFTMRSVEEMAVAFTNDCKYGEYDLRELFDKYTLYIVPMVNPDGTDISTAGDSPLYSTRVNNPDAYKLNANGVNLNRNYPFYWEERFAKQQTSPGSENYAGAVSASESETKTMIKLCSENTFEWLLDMHIVGGGIYWSDSQNGSVPDDYRLADSISKRCGLSMFPTTTTPANGGLENWFRYAYKRPGLCIELIPPSQSGRSGSYYGYNSFFENAVCWDKTKFIFPQAMTIL